MGPPSPAPPDLREAALRDRRHIYAAKTLRAVAYGALSGFLVLYLAAPPPQGLGYSALSSLVLTSLTLVGAAAWNLVALPRVERRFGRRRTLLLFGGLFALSAALLYLSSNVVVVLIAILIGGVAAATADNGPLASLDQAILPSRSEQSARASTFAYYNLLASFASAAGALLLVLPGALDPRSVPWLPPAPHPYIILIYLALAVGTWIAYVGLSEAVEVPAERRRTPGPALSAETRSHLSALAVLFGVDAFAGGMVVNPLIAAYFVLRWGQSAQAIGLILFVIGTVSAVSFLAAGPLSRRFGLLNTMVFTHLPSNVMLLLVPLMPTFPLSLGMLVARSALSQMDVPTRQAYTMDLVREEERTEVASTLAGSRGVAQSAGPFPALALQSAGYLGAPFVLAGVFKIVYDVMLYRRFRGIQPPGGRKAESAAPSADLTSGASATPD